MDIFNEEMMAQRSQSKTIIFPNNKRA